MLVDDNPVFLRATTQFLEAHDDVVVVGTAGGGSEALEQVRELQPRIILIDLAMSDLSGLATIPRLRHVMPEVGIIALTVMNSEGFREAALTAGADVFIPKATMRTDLLPTVRSLAHADRERPLKRAGHLSTEDSAPRRVLVMEDEVHLRRLYCKALRAAGYEVHPAATIQDAHALLVQIRFDILLCDISMGDDRGTDLLDEYAEALATSGAQVVMVSGHSHYRDMCAEIGADFFLEKPVSVGTLVSLVNRLTAQDDDHDPPCA
jgi:DNA-binding response OmpR family regulator